MARAGLGWTVSDLAEKISGRPATITNFEKGRNAKTNTVSNIKKAFLDTGLVTFTGDDCVCVKDASIDRIPINELTQPTEKRE